MDHIRSMILQYPILAPAIGGLLAHLVSYHAPPASLPAFASVILGIPAALTLLSQPQSPILYFLKATAIYLLTLGTSIAAYRLSPLHPLAKYPGPVLARVSRLWAAVGAIRGYQYLESHELFAKYGDVVRTGPNHLIMRNASAIPTIHGMKDRWPRHARQIVGVPYHAKGSMFTVIEPAEHDKRRRVWDRAFTPTAIKSYEPMLQRRLSQLLDALHSRVGTPIDLAEWFGLFSIDFMGDFAFGGMFDTMTQGGDVQGVHEGTDASVWMMEVFGTIPWMRPIVVRLPDFKFNKMLQFGLAVAEQRKKQGSQTRDIFHYLLHEDEEGGQVATQMSPMDMAFEALLAMGAGSDTTSTTLANVIYYLITHPTVFTRLRAELDAAVGGEGPVDISVELEQLGELKYLQAVIDETLRLLPLIPNGVQRTAHNDQGPLPVAGYVIPPGTSVQIPAYSLHRDPRYFHPSPEAFWPERWLPDEGPKASEASGQEFRLFKGAYMPFHYGPANCVGRSLAVHELRTLLAALVRRFDFAFAPGFEGHHWLGQMRDQFTLIRGELRVIMTERKPTY